MPLCPKCGNKCLDFDDNCATCGHDLIHGQAPLPSRVFQAVTDVSALNPGQDDPDIPDTASGLPPQKPGVSPSVQPSVHQSVENLKKPSIQISEETDPHEILDKDHSEPGIFDDIMDISLDSSTNVSPSPATIEKADSDLPFSASFIDDTPPVSNEDEYNIIPEDSRDFDMTELFGKSAHKESVPASEQTEASPSSVTDIRYADPYETGEFNLEDSNPSAQQTNSVKELKNTVDSIFTSQKGNEREEQQNPLSKPETDTAPKTLADPAPEKLPKPSQQETDDLMQELFGKTTRPQINRAKPLPTANSEAPDTTVSGSGTNVFQSAVVVDDSDSEDRNKRTLDDIFSSNLPENEKADVMRLTPPELEIEPDVIQTDDSLDGILDSKPSQAPAPLPAPAPIPTPAPPQEPESEETDDDMYAKRRMTDIRYADPYETGAFQAEEKKTKTYSPAKGTDAGKTAPSKPEIAPEIVTETEVSAINDYTETGSDKKQYDPFDLSDQGETSEEKDSTGENLSESSEKKPAKVKPVIIGSSEKGTLDDPEVVMDTAGSMFPSGSLDPQESLKQAWDLYNEGQKTYYTIAFIVTPIVFLFSFLFSIIGSQLDFMLITLPLSEIVISFLLAGIYPVVLSQIKGEGAELSNYTGSFRSAFSILLAVLIITFLAQLGLLLLIIPAFIVWTAYVFTLPFILDREYGFWEALEASRKAVQVDFREVLMFMVIGVFPLCIGGLFCDFRLYLEKITDMMGLFLDDMPVILVYSLYAVGKFITVLLRILARMVIACGYVSYFKEN